MISLHFLFIISRLYTCQQIDYRSDQGLHFNPAQGLHFNAHQINTTQRTLTNSSFKSNFGDPNSLNTNKNKNSENQNKWYLQTSPQTPSQTTPQTPSQTQVQTSFASERFNPCNSDNNAEIISFEYRSSYINRDENKEFDDYQPPIKKGRKEKNELTITNTLNSSIINPQYGNSSPESQNNQITSTYTQTNNQDQYKPTYKGQHLYAYKNQIQNNYQGPLETNHQGQLELINQGQLVNHQQSPLEPNNQDLNHFYQQGQFEINNQSLTLNYQQGQIHNYYDCQIQNNYQGSLQPDNQGLPLNYQQGQIHNNYDCQIRNNYQGPFQPYNQGLPLIFRLGQIHNNYDCQIQNNYQGQIHNYYDGQIQNNYQGSLQPDNQGQNNFYHQDPFQYNQQLSNQNFSNQDFSFTASSMSYPPMPSQSNSSAQNSNQAQTNQISVNDNMNREQELKYRYEIIQRINKMRSENLIIKNLIEEFEKLYPNDKKTSNEGIYSKNEREKLITLLTFYKEIYLSVKELLTDEANTTLESDEAKLRLAKYNTLAFKKINSYHTDFFITCLLDDIQYNDLALECILQKKYIIPEVSIVLPLFVKKYEKNTFNNFFSNVNDLLKQDESNLYEDIQKSLQANRLKEPFIFNFCYTNTKGKIKIQYIILQFFMKEIDIQTVFYTNLTNGTKITGNFSLDFDDKVNQETSTRFETNIQPRSSNNSIEEYNETIDLYSVIYTNEEERKQKIDEWKRDTTPSKINSFFSNITNLLNNEGYYNNEDIIKLIYTEVVNIFKCENIENLQDYSQTIAKLFTLFYYRFVLEYIASIKKLQKEIVESETPDFGIKDLIDFLEKETELNVAKTRFRIINYLVYSLCNINKTCLENYKIILSHYLDTVGDLLNHDKYIYSLFLNGAWYDNYLNFKKKIEAFEYTYESSSRYHEIYKGVERLKFLMCNIRLYFKIQCDFIWEKKDESKFKIGHNCKIQCHKNNVYCFVLYKENYEIYEHIISFRDLQEYMLQRDLENFIDEYIDKNSQAIM